jgi:PEP-CTERM motif
MQTKRGAKRSRRAGALMGAAGTLAGAVYGVVGSASGVHAAAIDVALSSAGVIQTTNPDASAFGSNNHGITPFVYGSTTPTNYGTVTGGGIVTTPVPLTTIADAPGQTYDAADTTDTGNTWNSLEGVTTNLAANTTATSYILEEQNVPLVDSTGASTGVTLNEYLRLPANKGTADGTRLFANSTTAGSDGLLPNPVNSLNSASSPGDGYGAGASHRELMGTGWSLNGTTEGLGFTLIGLTPSTTYNLYLYSGSSTIGQGGNFTAVSTILTDTNGNTTGGTATGTAVQTNTLGGANGSNFRSVFDSTGINPTPEKGQSWNLLSLTTDANGDASFALTGDSAGGIKPILNGFQIDLPSSNVPEPASALLLGLGGLGLLGRRRSRS